MTLSHKYKVMYREVQEEIGQRKRKYGNGTIGKGAKTIIYNTINQFQHMEQSHRLR